MVQAEFWATAVIALISWLVAIWLAALRIRTLRSGLAKAICWITPLAGLAALAVNLYMSRYGNNGGFSTIAMAVGSVLFMALAVILPILQFAFGYLAKVVDNTNS